MAHGLAVVPLCLLQRDYAAAHLIQCDHRGWVCEKLSCKRFRIFPGFQYRADAVLKIGKDRSPATDLCCLCFLSLKASSDNQNHAM